VALLPVERQQRWPVQTLTSIRLIPLATVADVTMVDTVTSPSERTSSPRSRVLDTVIGLGAIVLLLPALPILALVLAVDRLVGDDETLQVN
jgi:hypothetical protein